MNESVLSKEGRTAGWKLLISSVVVVGLAALYYQPMGLDPANAPIDGLQSVLYGLHQSYVLGGVPLALFAILLGADIISGEVSRKTIFSLISKPVRRSNILLTKYAVCAGTLLVAAILGQFLVFALTRRDYTSEAFGGIVRAVDFTGLVLSTLLLWMGTLSVLGLSCLFSVLARSTSGSAALTVLYSILLLLPGWWIGLVIPLQSLNESRFIETFTLPTYWHSYYLYDGVTFALTSFVVCFIAAAVPLLAAMWLFERKKF